MNTKKFDLKTIISLIKEIDSKFSIESENLEEKKSNLYSLSSLKNKIEFGLYYLLSEYKENAEGINNSVMIVNYKPTKQDSNFYINVQNPQLVHYKLSSIAEKSYSPGIHPTAIINENAKISDKAYIGPYCVIGDSVIEDHVVLIGHITINDDVLIKKNTIIEPNTLIGARGMAWIWDEDGKRIMQPQLGGVIIDEDCILGSDISIVRGSLSENTYVGKGSVIAHGSKIGHGCIIGNYVHFANNVSLAGNVQLKDRVFLGSGCVISSNVMISKGCIVGAGSVVTKSITEEFSTIAGVPGKIIKKNNYENKPSGAPKPYKEN